RAHASLTLACSGPKAPSSVGSVEILMISQHIVTAAVGSVLLLTPGASARATTVSPIEARAIAREAYVYSYAMMESYQTWRSQAVDKTANGYVGGFNVF